MTECLNAEMRDGLPDLVTGTGDEATRAAVLAHVSGCDACRAELELLRGVHGLLARGPVIDVARVSGRVVAATRRRRSNRMLTRFAAAVVLLAVGVEGVQLVHRAEAPEVVLADSMAGAAGDDGATTLAVGAGLTELADADLDRLLVEIERFDGLMAVEPGANAGNGTVDGGRY